ncbi:MAG: PTPDL family protein [Verrucomicrobiales bacterium]
MKPLISLSRSLLPLVLATLMCLGAASADTIKLKTGKALEGEIMSENSGTVTIKYRLGGITDVKTVPRSEIASLEKKSPEDVAATEVKSLLPSDDFLLPGDYRRLIQNGPDKFLAKYPASKYRGEIEKVKTALQDEMMKTKQGMRKVDGKWLGGRELQANEYNINSLKHLRAMEKLVKADRYKDALLAFRELEATGKMSVHYAKAIELAEKVLDKYSAQLAQMAKDVPQKLKEKEEELRTLTPDQKKEAEAFRAKQKKEFAAMIIDEKKQKLPFTTVGMTELASIQEAEKQAAAEKARLAALKKDAIANSAAEYEKVLKLIGAQKLEEASVRLDQFIKNDKVAGADKDIKAKAEELKKLREESLRMQRQEELRQRSQPKAPEAPKAPESPAPPKPQ